MNLRNEFEESPERVWQRIGEFEPDQVDQVIQWTVENIRHDAGLLVERLESFGYAFSYDTPVRPDHLRDADLRTIGVIEEMAGERLPAFYRAFCEEIGCLLLDGRATPGSRMALYFPTEMVDEKVSHWGPLELLPLGSCVDEVEYLLEEGYEPGLMLITDPVHLAGSSGGPPLGILANDPGPDPRLLVEADEDMPTGTSLLEYIRIALRHGGFQGLSQTLVNKRTRSFIDELTEGFKGF